MALKATIFKSDLQIADMDRHYYATHPLVIARHPSEDDERMMVRLLAFALNANESLAFTKGLSDTDEPDIWDKDLTGAIQLWIELGQPDEKRIRQACGRAEKVAVFTYSGNSADVWWKGIASKLERLDNLQVINVPVEMTQTLATLANRNMQLQCTIQDGQVWLADNSQSIEAHFTVLKAFK
ncbi:YaeQ family protein [Iodobacter fluviatilis]|uniref:YaeQ family protein n=1 Tax=Iodobacter fluviatilis TaxID=537 RepID=A0A7G3G6Z4_9NEIS|nr:YaeQ family protein [Iodobacter fluviatilis]QBC42959.1 hypothetical protein C1H71_04940 [Iodobacter fluviatilis]